MPEVPSSAKGRCRCGRVEFEVHSKPMVTMACHCTGCQRMSSSAFSLSALFPGEAFTVTRGEPVIGGLRGATRHFFCDYCMSWLFTRPEGEVDLVNVRSSMFENAADYRPFIDTFTKEKLEWASTGAVHGFDEFPPQEQFPSLLQQYADTRE
ncbi:hypothetical protein SAMN05877962_101196 [Alloalcanivorax xenomutans]|uniref:GFA family protein n=1 Tax=Alloalcanivorax xenomutans TaxID=1094342 RepID=UPI000BDA0305|nr:hypothetical protein SAMN05877962_101196 [Alloalcanivorax xenomutans]